MKGAILIPTAFADTIPYKVCEPLFELVGEEFGFGRFVRDEVLASEFGKYDVVITVKSPQKFHVDNLRGYENLPERVKVVPYFTDIHPHLHPVRALQSGPFLNRMTDVLDRACVIASAFDEVFRNFWPKYVDKMVWLPQFVGLPDEAEQIPDGIERQNLVLMSGAHGFYYPLRKYIYRNEELRKYLGILKHPGYKVGYAEAQGRKGVRLGADFYHTLSEYIGGISTTSILGCVLMKHFEIQAVGSLLLSDWCEDMDELGLIDGVNFVRIDETTVSDVLSRVCEHPKDFSDVAERGRKLALSNHTIHNRLETFREILEML